MNLRPRGWLASIALHLLSGAGLSCLIVITAPPDETSTRGRIGQPVRPPIYPEEAPQQAEPHPPFVPPPDFQPDREIVNDAREVVANSIPENERLDRTVGDPLDFLTDKLFRGKGLYGTIGTGLAGGGRYGSYSKRFG